MSAHRFELRVFPLAARVAGRHGPGEYGLALYQLQGRSRAGATSEDREDLVVRLWGTPFRASVDRILAALKDNGYRASDLSRARRTPFALSEESGVRVGLLFLGAKPLRQPARVEAIGGGVWTMGSEEAYYWFSKCTDPWAGRRAQRALRLLFGGG